MDAYGRQFLSFLSSSKEDWLKELELIQSQFFRVQYHTFRQYKPIESDYYERLKRFEQFLQANNEKLIKQKLGQGGSGTVYRISDQIVMKSTRMCLPSEDPRSRLGVNKVLCAFSKEGSLSLTFPQSDQLVYYMPNYLSEYLIGILLWHRLQTYTPSFIEIKGGLFDQNKERFLLFMENLSPITQKIKSKTDFYYLFFIIFYSLHVAQVYYRFSHNDLHLGNIMARAFDSSSSQTFPLNNGKLLSLQGFDYIPVMTDFGLSQLELKQTHITPRYTLSSPKIQGLSVSNWNFFNPYLDGFSLYGALSVFKAANFTANTYSLGKQQSQWFKDTSGRPLWHEQIDRLLFRSLLKKDLPENELRALRYKIYSWSLTKPSTFLGTWRPDPVVLNTQDIYAEPIETARFWARKLVESGKGVISELLPMTDERRIEYEPVPIRFDNNFIERTIKSTDSIDNVIKIESYQPENIDWSKLRSFPDSYVPSYHRTPSEEEKRTCNTRHQHITVAYINTFKSKLLGYELKNDCCRLDLFEYLKNYKSGVVINSSYFDPDTENKTHFMPIGPFRNDNFKSNFLEVPPEYRNLYGVVALNPENNEIDILKYDQLDKVATSKYNFFVVGPVIVDDNKTISSGILFDPRFQCSTQGNPDLSGDWVEEHVRYRKISGTCQETTITPNPNVKECKYHQKGRLGHLANPNPRSALVIRSKEAQKDGKGDLALVYVEGRDQRGVGMDVYQLAEFCREIVGAEKAINLDGGASSNLVWRKEEAPQKVFAPNPRNLKTYPVGTVLAWVRK